MHYHCGINKRSPRLTFTDPCKPEGRPGAREELASPVWLSATAMNARDTKVIYGGLISTNINLNRLCSNTGFVTLRVYIKHFTLLLNPSGRPCRHRLCIIIGKSEFWTVWPTITGFPQVLIKSTGFPQVLIKSTNCRRQSAGINT